MLNCIINIYKKCVNSSVDYRILNESIMIDKVIRISNINKLLKEKYIYKGETNAEF